MKLTTNKGLRNHMDNRLKHEIEHGKKIASGSAEHIWNWSSPAGIERFKRRVNMLSQDIHEGMNVLEIGCGTGLFTHEFVKTDAHITAIDISPDLLELAKERTPENPKLQFRLENAYQMTFANETFDTIIGSSILHHLDINKALMEFQRVLKPKGRIVFTEPNMMNPQIALERHVPFLRKLLYVSPDETAFFRWQLKKQLLSWNFTEIQIVPFDFLHPMTSKHLIPFIKKMGKVLEMLPLTKEIAGSLFICARKA